MDDLVFVGALGITGLCIAAIILLYGAYSVAGLMYAALVSGQYGVIIILGAIILVAVSLYMAAGCWLQKTGRI
jgi:hypothetical protein